MTITLRHWLLPFLVALATAAPLAEESKNLEQAVSVNGDNAVVDRAKRAKEEIVFGNQQNGGRPGMSKKSFNMPLLMAGQGFMPRNMVDPDTVDKAGHVFATNEKPMPPELQPSVVEEPKTLIEETKTIIEEAKPVVEESKPVLEQLESRVPEPSADVTGEKSEEDTETGSGKETGSGEVTVIEEIASPEAEESQALASQQLPEDSKDEDAEEVLEGQRLAESEEKSDEVEKVLKELHKDNEGAEEEVKSEMKEDLMEEEEKEGEKERENQEEADEIDLDDSRNVLQFLLSGGGQLNRVPYPYAVRDAYLQRRRRSLAHRKKLPHIRSRHRSKELARAKRTKRDLLDDDLYYNEDEDDFELPPDTNEADLEELMAYLLSLYPSLYGPQGPPQQIDFPGYDWLGQGYPEESYPAPEIPVPDWDKPEYPPEYMETPVGWESAPGWEPAFYPEQVEEESPYLGLAKRQMLSFVPGMRRKRYFFPFAREPYTHWGAFVPAQEKRNYEDAYRRLRELALVLADARNPSPYDAFEEDRKKK